MYEAMIQDVEQMFAGKAFLTVSEVALFMRCSEEVVYNLTRRPNPKRRPPKIGVGKEIRFPKRHFAQWLTDELTG